MTPHHAGAILIFGKAPIEDAEIKPLCQSIIDGQLSEIDRMKAILAGWTSSVWSRPLGYSLTARKRSEFAITLTDDKAMAAAAMIGDRSNPNVG